MEKYFLLYWLFLAALLLSVSSGSSTAADVWEEIQALARLDGQSFRKVANPLVEMAANAYRYPDVIPIPGWTEVDAVAPIHGGMHAIVYKDDSNSGRMVLAFRGTDISGSESSRADVCADETLWGDQPLFTPLDCSEFSVDTLDYYKQAVDYTKGVLDKYPEASLLLTGHSLGAGLAVLVTATFGENPLLPVVAFSAAGTKTVLQRMDLRLSEVHEKTIYIIADKWDEIMRSQWGDQIGTLCLYETVITDDCEACFAEAVWTSSTGLVREVSSAAKGGRKMPKLALDQLRLHLIGSSIECFKCFFETHYLRHVIDLVEIGDKPVCESQAVRNKETDQ